jgi:hypothetical protein
MMVAPSLQEEIMLEIEDNVYVVVCERDDKDLNMMNQGPIVLETYVFHATKERATRRIKNLNGQLGNCRIARLVFEDDPAEGDANASTGDAGTAS